MNKFDFKAEEVAYDMEGTGCCEIDNNEDCFGLLRGLDAWVTITEEDECKPAGKVCGED